jgi:translation initiation factor IF-1
MKRRHSIAIAAAFFAAAILAMPAGLLAHGHGHVQGTVNSIDAAKIDVKTEDGKSRQVTLTGKTKYVRGEAAAKLADVKPGERVVVHLGEDGSALEVHLAPAAGSPQAGGDAHKH